MSRHTTSKTTRPGKTGNSGGRPPKFSEPSRSVTVTLPQRTLDLLRWIDTDRAKAIVKTVDDTVGAWKGVQPQVEVIEMAPGTGLLVVPPNPSLNGVKWLKMIKIASARYLLVIDPGTSIEKIEVSLMDMIEEAKRSRPQELGVLEVLRTTFGKLRRAGQLSKAEVLLVDIDR